MSKLYELVQQYCPNGVDFKPIKEVYQRLKGTPITAAKLKMQTVKFESLQVEKQLLMHMKRIFQRQI